jgi:hypothetical protein
MQHKTAIFLFFIFTEHGSVLQLEALAQYQACRVGHGPVYLSRKSVLHNNRRQTNISHGVVTEILIVFRW